jgi:hypothetical protein
MNRGFKNMQNFEDHPDLRELLKEEEENGMFKDKPKTQKTE